MHVMFSSVDEQVFKRVFFNQSSHHLFNICIYNIIYMYKYISNRSWHSFSTWHSHFSYTIFQTLQINGSIYWTILANTIHTCGCIKLNYTYIYVKLSHNHTSLKTSSVRGNVLARYRRRHGRRLPVNAGQKHLPIISRDI